MFWHSLDTADFDRLCSLFAPNGVWHRHGELLEGPVAVRVAMASRSPSLQTQHLVSNVVIEVVTSDSARGASRMQLFRHDDFRPIDLPLPMAGPHAVIICEHQFVRIGGAWRIALHHSTAVFGKAASPQPESPTS